MDILIKPTPWDIILSTAVEENNYQLAREAVYHGAICTWWTIDSWGSAARKGHYDAIIWSIREGVAYPDCLGVRLLQRAITDGTMDQVVAIAEFSPDTDDAELLIWACTSGRKEIVQWVLEEKKVAIGCRAISAAASADHVELCQYLLERGADFATHAEELLCRASNERRLAQLEWLLQFPLDDQNYDMTLHLACLYSNLEMIRLLLPYAQRSYTSQLAENMTGGDIRALLEEHLRMTVKKSARSICG